MGDINLTGINKLSIVIAKSENETILDIRTDDTFASIGTITIETSRLPSFLDALKQLYPIDKLFYTENYDVGSGIATLEFTN